MPMGFQLVAYAPRHASQSFSEARAPQAQPRTVHSFIIELWSGWG